MLRSVFCGTDPFNLPCAVQSEGGQVEVAQAVSVDSIPEVVDDKDSVPDHTDPTSVHDMDYVNPRGVRFTQSTQRDGRETCHDS